MDQAAASERQLCATETAAASVAFGLGSDSPIGAEAV